MSMHNLYIKSLLLFLNLAFAMISNAQHEQHMTGENRMKDQDTSKMNQSMMMNESVGTMSHAFSLNRR
jgi:hypothetical protein